MNTLNILKRKGISIRSPAGAVQDISALKYTEQKKLLCDIFGGTKLKFPSKKYLVELTLKYLVRDIVTDQITAPFSNLKPYNRALRQAKSMSKESIYAKYVLANQKAKREKRKQKT